MYIPILYMSEELCGTMKENRFPVLLLSPSTLYVPLSSLLIFQVYQNTKHIFQRSRQGYNAFTRIYVICSN